MSINVNSLCFCQIAKLLEQHNADFSAKDKDGNTPAKVAQENGHDRLDNFIRGKETFAFARVVQPSSPLCLFVFYIIIIIIICSSTRITSDKQEARDVHIYILCQYQTHNFFSEGFCAEGERALR